MSVPAAVSDVRFDEYFGFTDEEVRAILDYYGLGNKYSIIKEWYDGYRFGRADVYCPWDVVNYCSQLRFEGCQEALEQIDRMGYDARLRQDGMEMILKYGIACHKKQCRVCRG